MSGETEKRLAIALLPLVSRMRTDASVVKDSVRGVWKPTPDQNLTTERLISHLNGGPARGLYVMKPGRVTMVGVLDLDSHKGETPWPAMVALASALVESLRLMGGEPVAFRSGGGSGIHLYCLWEEAQDAYSVRAWFLDALRSCGYKNGTGGVKLGQVEIFPKADHVAEGRYGTQVFLPLGGKSVPLVWEDLVGELVVAPREAALGMHWPMSEPVPAREAPVHVPRAVGEVSADLRVIADALQAITVTVNAGLKPMGHDTWLVLMQALHKESVGSEDGRALAHAWCEATAGFDPDETPDRLDKVWDTSDASREGGVGAGTIFRIARECGWVEPIDDSAFSDESAGDSRPPVAAVEWAPDVGSTRGGVEVEAEQAHVEVPPAPPAPPTPPKLLAKIKRRSIPEAHYLTTDQANAQRLKDSFGAHVVVAAGKWHVWDGRRWAMDESDVYRYACKLSDLVRAESRDWKAKGEKLVGSQDPAEVDEGKRRLKVAEALGKWALKCEMKGTIEAAIGLARKMLTLEAEELDRDPDLLNCLNGTIDLRTGMLKAHDPSDFITKLVPVKYRPNAECLGWLRALDEISGGVKPLVKFLQRWFGYALTGRTTEQAFAVLHGPGGNGKSVLVEMMVATMGDYAGTAAPGLLVASKGADRHPTEIMSLMGRRMVTAHESGEGVVLREDFVKQATGGDKLTGRFMREDFVEFSPTHKIQLLTNHKPGVKGQDAGIWRRVMLVPFLVTFGTLAQVEAGTHMRVKDLALLERLQAELEGVLAWRVRGAVDWYRAGLQAPAVVLSASEAYKSEQDRVGQFVGECCEVGMAFEEPLAGAGGTMSSHDGLYPAYVVWCKDGGVFPLSKARFADDVLRVMGVGEIVVRKMQVAGGGRRNVRVVRGIRLMAAE